MRVRIIQTAHSSEFFTIQHRPWWRPWWTSYRNDSTYTEKHALDIARRLRDPLIIEVTS